MSEETCRLAVLLSGTGSTMVNLQEHLERGEVSARIEVVVSSRHGVLGLERAESLGIPTKVLTRKSFWRESVFEVEAYSAALADLLEEYSPDLVVMAGFMTRLAEPMLSRYPVMNVHPALLPMFGGTGCYGRHVHEAVLEAGVKVTGATVHFADEEYDHGPIIMQEEVEVREDDTADALAARVQEAERRIYPKAVAAFARGLIRVDGRRAILSSEEGE